MTVLASIDLQTLGDAFGQGAIYALMAVGIGLVFGVLRLVNFAYGQLIMAGAYTLAYTSGLPVVASIVACFAVVVALSLAMDRLVFRPLRSSSPAAPCVRVRFVWVCVWISEFGVRWQAQRDTALDVVAFADLTPR